MTTIKLLPPDLISKIAAGEVVERPASVVKELVENSIDAKASEIKVTIENGGINFIQVSDNGIGMSADDAKLALVQHATSKLSAPEDLNKIFTLGFRGEALASISSVSDTSIHSKTTTSEAVETTYLNGKIVLKTAAARNTGTTVTVRNLFHKLPARRKFLKSENSEYKKIISTFLEMALAHHEIKLSLDANGKMVYELDRTENFSDRIVQIYPALKHGLIPVYYSDRTIAVEGFIGHPKLNRRDRQQQYLFINSRPIKDPTISQAVKTGFGTNLMQHQHPVFFLKLTIDTGKVDVNVHPRKEEVRFDNPREIFKIIYKTVRTSLEKTLRDELHDRFSDSGFSLPTPSVSPTNRLSANKPTSKTDFKQLSFTKKPTIGQGIAFTKELLQSNDSEEFAYGDTDTGSQFVSETKPSKILQLFKTYLVLEQGQEVLIIDQHAAAERVAFEEIERKFKQAKQLPAQSLLLPEKISISKAEQLQLQDRIAILRNFGFNIKLSQTSLEILSVPESLIKAPLKTVFTELLAELSSESKVAEKEESRLLHKIISTIACHGSIRAGQELTDTQAGQLIENLLKCKQPYSCPHGRPIIYSLTKTDLEKQFKRKI